MGDDNFRPPTEFTPLNRSPKNCYRWLCWQPLWLCQIWCKSVHGVFSANGWNITIFLFIYTFLSGDHLQVRPVNGFLRLMTQTTRTRAKGVPFGFFFVDTAPHFGSEIPKIPILGAWTGVFKTNGQNIESFTLSKLGHRFQPISAQE